MELKETKLAIVLLDLIGSTQFVQKVGAMKAAQWLQYHDRLARSLIYKFDGREIDRSDGFLLSFERPIDAVNFALIYQQTVPKKTLIQARVGIHFGKVVEVKQDELSVMAGAKSTELEGISKNIAARTMSICIAGQVLLTAEAMQAVKGRTNAFTPAGTYYACVGEYRFKGVRASQIIYAVGASIQSLQPPQSNEKVKRLGGPKRIRSKMKDRAIKEHVWWLMKGTALIMLCWLISIIGPVLIDPHARMMSELHWYFWWLDILLDSIKRVIR